LICCERQVLPFQMAFDGNQQMQAKSLHSKCETLAIAFQRCQSTKADTIQGYRSILLPKLRYGVSTTNINSKNLTKSQQLITQSILPKMGFNRHTPTAILYSSKHFGGFGLLDMTIEKGIAHVNFLIGHLK
jgi:hypothetical protein